MKGFKLTENTTLVPPDNSGDIEVISTHNGVRNPPEYVSFESLEKWIASEKEPSNTRMQIVTDPCNWCATFKKLTGCDWLKYCPNCGRGLSD